MKNVKCTTISTFAEEILWCNGWKKGPSWWPHNVQYFPDSFLPLFPFFSSDGWIWSPLEPWFLAILTWGSCENQLQFMYNDSQFPKFRESSPHYSFSSPIQFQVAVRLRRRWSRQRGRRRRQRTRRGGRQGQGGSGEPKEKANTCSENLTFCIRDFFNLGRCTLILCTEMDYEVGPT